MNNRTTVCHSLGFLLGIMLVAGCEPSDQGTTGLENREQGRVVQNDDGKNNKQDEHYTSGDHAPERARSIEEGHEDMDVLTPEDPVMAYAHYHTVEFAQGVARLTADQEESLDEFIASLDRDKPVYVTIRMEDTDTLDATEPAPEFKKLADSRVNQVAGVFERGEVEIAELKVDESGVIETPGEDRALARESEADNGNGQLVVITINADDDGAEPSDTIPHSPNV